MATAEATRTGIDHGSPARFSGGRLGRWGVLLALGVILAIIVVPIIVVAAGSFWSAPFINQPGHLTLDNYRTIISNNRAANAALDTLQMTIGASAVALLLGGLQAWIIARTNVPFRAILRWLPVAPLLLSALITNTGFIALFSPRTGIVNTLWMDLVGTTEPLFNIYSMPGLILSLGTHLAPIAYLVLLGPLMSMSRTLDEASRASGASALRTFWHVTLPLVRPALLASFTLTAILASHAFETPLLIGLPAQITTYVSEIYLSIAGSVNYSQASAQAMVYLVLIGVLLLWNRRVTRIEARYATIAGKDHNPIVRDVGVRRWIFFATIILIFLVSFGALLGANMFLSLLPFYSPNRPLPPLTLDNYRDALQAPAVVSALRNSFFLAGTVAVVAVGLATFLTVVAHKTRARARRLAEEIGTVPVAFPPLIFSIALLITVLSLPWTTWLYNTVYLLIGVLVVVFLPFALSIMGSAILSIDDSLLEASASSGARLGRTLRSIVLPLLSTAVVGAMALVFILSFRELGAIALITPPTTDLMPTLIYGMYTTGIFRQVYALNTISFFVTIAAFGVLATSVTYLSRRVAHHRQMGALLGVPEAGQAGVGSVVGVLPDEVAEAAQASG